jgi:hypothetical protein
MLRAGAPAPLAGSQVVLYMLANVQQTTIKSIIETAVVMIEEWITFVRCDLDHSKWRQGFVRHRFGSSLSVWEESTCRSTIPIGPARAPR